jgi:succinyl-diaminopimelate desuccinylase
MDLDLDQSGAALTAQLVDVPSVSGEEGPLADAIERALRPLAHLAVTRDGDTIVARTELGRAERVILAGHIDTVPVAGNLPSRADGSRLYGCGTSDMKAGVAVQLRLAAHLPTPSRDLTYVFYECEEVAAERNGLLRLSRTAPALLAGDFAVLMEPSAGLIEGGCQGTLRAEVTAAGKRAHTARAWMGRNAIHEAADILAVLRSYVPREPEVDGLRYHEGLNAVAVRGGVAGNVIPDECVVTVNYRFAPDLDGQQAADFVRSLFPDRPVELIDVAEGARPGLGHPAAAAFVAAVGAGLEPPRAKLGWTDVARFAALGIPAVNYGPGLPELAHTAAEYVETGAIADCEARLRAWLGALPGATGRYRGGPSPSVTRVVCREPWMSSQPTDTTLPGWYLAVMAVSESGVVTAWPSTEMITSPGARPRDCAAVPHKMPRMSAPVFAGAILDGTAGCWPSATQAVPLGALPP